MPAQQLNKTEVPLFAQPVAPDPARMTRTNLSGVGLFALPTLLCGALLFLAQPDNAQSQNSGAARPANEAKSNGPVMEAVEEKDKTERPPIWFYTQSVRGNLFSAPPPPEPPKPKVVKTPPVVTRPTPPVVVMVNPFQDWVYAGTIKVGDNITALLENSKTKEGQYVTVGSSIMGAEVTHITDQQVTVMAAGKPTTIAKSDTITVVPLTKSAEYLSAPTAPPPGQPGMPGAAPGAMPQMAPGMPAGMPPGMNMQGGRGRMAEMMNNPQVRQRFESMMNRRFNR
jgi:hypothetical protein